MRKAFLGPHRVTLTNEEAPISQVALVEKERSSNFAFPTDEDARKTPKTVCVQMETNDRRGKTERSKSCEMNSQFGSLTMRGGKCGR